MRYAKPPLTIVEQIQLLKDRGLHFDDEEKAKNYLSNISYYRLRGYTYPFQDNSLETQHFIEEVSFEQIINLYVFDRKLRLIILDAIEKIEVAFRTQIIYHFSLSYGSHWHLKPDLFKNQERYNEHLLSIQKEINRSQETFIKHYRHKYTDPPSPPCWMSLEVISIGLLSKIFQNLKKSEEKKAITKHFGLEDFVVLENWFLCFSNIRNICAHHGRVWNRRLTPIKIPTNPSNVFLNDTNIHSNKLYATLSCIQYIIIQISPNSTFYSRLKEHLGTCSLVSEKDIGFPQNWEEEAMWL